MTHTDFKNFVKHRPYYVFKNDLGKFFRIQANHILLSIASEGDSTAYFYKADHFKARKQQQFWVTEAEAQSRYPEYFI